MQRGKIRWWEWIWGVSSNQIKERKHKTKSVKYIMQYGFVSKNVLLTCSKELAVASFLNYSQIYYKISRSVYKLYVCMRNDPFAD